MTAVGYPSFIAEMGQEANRPRLWQGIGSGYALAASFATLLLAANLFELIPWRWELWAMVVFKLVTNTAALVSLRTRRAVLEISGLNVFADVLVMTGAVYWSGGQLSPLAGIYIIEITVIALLTNLGITMLVAAGAFLFYALVAIATHVGAIAQYAPPLGLARPIDVRYLIFDLVWTAFLLGVATVITSIVLRRLRVHERALEQRTAEVLEAGRLKSQFMANISHELRTPIQGILGVADLVQTEVYGPVNETQKKAQRSIKRSALSLLEMIEDLLKLAMADAGQLQFKPQTVDVRDTIAQAVASTRWMLETKSLSISVHSEAEVDTVVTDRGKLNQVLIHLISNAVKFTPAQGQVLLRASVDDHGWLCLAVTDTGVGIPEEHQQSIFEDFRQVDGTAERAEGGMGIGLGLVRRLIKLMGGEVRLSSTVGEGSTFTVRLPPEPPAEQIRNPKRHARPHSPETSTSHSPKTSANAAPQAKRDAAAQAEGDAAPADRSRADERS